MATKYLRFSPPVHMKESVRNLWLDLLVSGQYEQANSKLSDGVGFCCLGVLCDIHSQVAPKNQRGEWEEYLSGFEQKYDGVAGMPSLKVDKWALPELKTLDQEREVFDSKKKMYDIQFPDTPSGRAEAFITTLARMNDEGKTFVEIAKYIEQNTVGV